MYKISVNKELFNDIQIKKIAVLEKNTSSYWKRELLEPIIEKDKIRYKIKQIDKILITNGLGDDKSQLIMECLKVDYSFKKDIFEFYLGKIIEQKNTDTQKDYKDTLIEQLLREKAMLEDSINRDQLTDVYNRKKLLADLENYSNQANSDHLNIAFIDADRFKYINNKYSHEVGDKTLLYLVKTIQKYANLINAEVYRYDSDKFVLVSFTQKAQLLLKLESLRKEIDSQVFIYKQSKIDFTISIGLSSFVDYNSSNIMLSKAQEAVKIAKSKGRNRIEIV